MNEVWITGLSIDFDEFTFSIYSAFILIEKIQVYQALKTVSSAI